MRHDLSKAFEAGIALCTSAVGGFLIGLLFIEECRVSSEAFDVSPQEPYEWIGTLGMYCTNTFSEIVGASYDVEPGVAGTVGGLILGGICWFGLELTRQSGPTS